jgi:glycosyltransferase involved in cell wall biosynthesis
MRRFFLIFLFTLSTLFSQTSDTNKKFVVLIASYNNEKFVEKNLKSALDQNYTNYRIIYVDDASTDATHEIAQKIQSSYPHKKMAIIHNEKNKGAMFNINSVIRQLEDDEIVCILDGDDWFSRNDVLEILNTYYKNPDVWLTYGSYMTLHDGKRGYCSKKIPEDWIKNKSYRKNPWLTSHLRTFYAGLFKKIKETDLLKDGEFLKSATDMAIMFPMLEMANGRFRFVEQILYVYNNITSLNNHLRWPKLQKELDSFIRAKPPYETVNSLFNLNELKVHHF